MPEHVAGERGGAEAAVTPAAAVTRAPAAGLGGDGGDRHAAVLALQARAGNQATGRLLARSGTTVAKPTWRQERILWIRDALKADNWDGVDPPGAYFVFNGLSTDDMIAVYNALTAAERQKLEANLDKTALDRSRMYQAVQQAKQGGTWWRAKSEAVHWAIRKGDLTGYPDGAFWLINPLNDVDRATVMRFLDRDDLDELVAHEPDAVAAGVPHAKDIGRKAYEARSGRQASAEEQRIAALVPGGAPVTLAAGQTVDLPAIKADCREAFKALAPLNDTELLRALRALPQDKRFTLTMNIDQVDALGIDGNRIRHFLARADATADRLVASRIEDAIWHPDYKRPQNAWSHVLRLSPPGNLTTEFELSIDEVADETMPEEEVARQWREAKIGRGGLLWPAKLNTSTVPNLSAMKRSVLKEIADLHAMDVLFVIQAFMAIEFVLHAGVGVTSGGVAAVQRRPRGGGPFGTGGRLRTDPAAEQARLKEMAGSPTRADVIRPKEFPYTNPPDMVVVGPGKPLDVGRLDPAKRYLWVLDPEGSFRIAAEGQGQMYPKRGSLPRGHPQAGQTPAKHRDLTAPPEGASLPPAGRIGGTLRPEIGKDGRPTGKWIMDNESSYVFAREDRTHLTGEHLNAAHQLLNRYGTDTTRIVPVNTSGADVPR